MSLHPGVSQSPKKHREEPYKPVEACPEPAEWGLCFDKLSTNELANKSGWINNSKTFFDHL
jgi:hypothetical protein